MLRGFLLAIALAPSVGLGQTDGDGFVQTWLILGPYGQEGGAAPPESLLGADYLTDGTAIEECMTPADGETIATDYGVARSTDYRGAGLPMWHAWRDADDGIDLNDDVFGPALGDPDRCMAYACVYIENLSGNDRRLVGGLGSDDAVEVLVGPESVFRASVARSWGNPRDIQDRFPVTLRPGNNRILVKIFEGTGEWGFRFRLETQGGWPITAETPGYRFSLERGGLSYVASVGRELPDRAPPGVGIPCALDVLVASGPVDPVSIEEVVPAGWSVESVGQGGTVAGRTIRWTVAGKARLSYVLVNPGGGGGRWEGSYAAGGRTFSIGGDRVVAGSEVDRNGFIRRWLILGPLRRAGGPAPGAAALGADYLTDGTSVWEETVLPEPGGSPAIDFCGAAASSDLAPNAIGLTTPVWDDHTDADDTICFEGSPDAAETWYFDPAGFLPIDDFMAYAAIYVDNLDAQARLVNLGIASDDAVACLLNTGCVFAKDVARGYGAPGTVEDVVENVVLAPGRNRLLLKIFEGDGASGFRLRLQDGAGDPLFFPIAVVPGALKFPVRVVRSLPVQWIEGEIVAVKLAIDVVAAPAPAELTIVEAVPAGWAIADAGGGGASGTAITWTLGPAGNRTLVYRVVVPEPYRQGVFSGTWSTGGPAYGIGGACASSPALTAGLTADGFVADWLVLGPYALGDCGAVEDGCGGAGQPPCCSAPGDEQLRADYLTDGVLTERTIEPYEGFTVATKFGAAASVGLLAVPRADVNPSGKPAWFSWHAGTGLVDFNGMVFGGGDPQGCMAYAAAYLHNDTGAPLPVSFILGSDDSPAVLLNGEVVHARNVAPTGRAYGGPPDFQDRIGPVTLRSGENRLLVKIFEGWGDWSFALGIRDAYDRPLTQGIRVALMPVEGGPGARVSRQLPAVVEPGALVTVALAAQVRPGNRITIEETVPAGWPVVDRGGGSLDGGRLVWSDVTSSRTIVYRVGSDATVNDGVFAGSIGGTVQGRVGGDAVAVRRVVSSDLAPWRLRAIGGAFAAAATFEPGEFDVWTMGSDVGDSNDQFAYLCREASGDFTMVARVESIRPSDPWAKAGLMARFGLCSDDPYWFVCATPGHGTDWQYRALAGGEAEVAGSRAGFAPPRYVLLTGSRSTRQVVAASSADGREWIVHGDGVLPGVPGTLYIGLAASSHDPRTLGGASYRGVELADFTLVPPRDLACTYEGEARLRWRNPVAYDAISVVRYGPAGRETLATLHGSATTHTDRTALGSTIYRVYGLIAGMGLYAECDVDAGVPCRVNCGGASYVDRRARAWIPDGRFLLDPAETNVAYSTEPVENSEDTFLFQSERWLGVSGKSIAYAFPVPDGAYRVELWFDELCDTCRSAEGPDGVPGTPDDGGFGRTFNVFVEGRLVLEAFQPAVAASAEAGRGLPGGESHIAIVRAASAEVGDGELSITLMDLGDGNPPENPKISAIAILPESASVAVLAGDGNGDRQVNIADAVAVLAYLFAAGPSPSCRKSADANDDDRLDVADPITILAYLFAGGALVGPDGRVLAGADNACLEYPAADVEAIGCAAPCVPIR